MSIDEIKGFVNQDSIRSFGDGALAPLKLNRRGEMCVVDFYTQMALEKRGFELRAGKDSAEETGDQPVATTAADVVIDAVSGLAIIPCFFAGTITTGGTINEIHLKTVGTRPTAASTALAALPLWKGSTIASTAVCEVDDEGGAATAADGVTTTNCLFTWGGATAPGAYDLSWEWKPLMPHIGIGPLATYVQIGGATVGPEYLCTIHWIELPTIALD